MKKIIFLIIAATLSNCANPNRGVTNPGMGQAVEAMDGNRGDVPSVNHPNYNPNPFFGGGRMW